MSTEMIYRFSLDTYIYSIDRDHVLTVCGSALRVYSDAGHSYDTLHNPQFWMQLVGQPGVYISEPPYPPEFGRPVSS